MVESREGRRRQGRVALLAAAVSLSLPALGAPLPALDAEKTFTVSGLSSGAYMAVQVHVAHSARVTGVGAVAGGPYYCAQGSLSAAYNNCMTPGGWFALPATSTLKSRTEAFAKANQIDSTKNIAAARIWLFSGTADKTVLPPVVQALKAYYESFNAKPVLVADKPAGHGMVTEEGGNACSTTAPPYVNDCDYDAAGELLRHLLQLNKPSKENPKRLLEFDQDAYGLRSTGFVYVPASCEKERCRVHVAFHGCRQTAKEFAQGAGYNRWAEPNRLIVLYPEVKASWWPYNPRGCWDWWGYSGREYATKEGAQVRAVLRMVERLSAPRQ